MAELGENVVHLTKRPNKDCGWSFGKWLWLFTHAQERYMGTLDGIVRTG